MKAIRTFQLMVALAGFGLCDCLHLPFRSTVRLTAQQPPSQRNPTAWVQRRSFGAAVASGAGTLVGAPRWSWGEAMSALTKAPPDARILPPDCDQAVSHLVDKATGREIYLIGTAHISNVSAALVDATIRAVNPSLIAVELDASRLRGLADSTQPIYSYSGRLVSGNPDASIAPTTSETKEPAPGVKPERKGFLGQLKSRFGVKLDDLGPAVIGKALQQMYRSMDEAGFQSGNEFKLAIEGGARLQCFAAWSKFGVIVLEVLHPSYSQVPVLLADQPVDRTLRRLSEAIQASDFDSLSQPNSKLEAKLQALEDSAPELKELANTSLNNPVQLAAVVELIKERATVGKVMNLVKEEVPEVYEAMIGERDRFMAASIHANAPKDAVVVMVVGIAHADGIERTLVSDKGWALAPMCAPSNQISSRAAMQPVRNLPL